MIVLYGNLRKQFGNTINSIVSSVNELMKACEANRPGFRSYIQKDRNYVIRRGDSFKSGNDVVEPEVDMLFTDKTWHILPLPIGHKGGFFGVILGAVLSVVGLVTGQPWLVKIGIGIALSGIASMLAPVPEVSDYANREAPDERPSYLFDGPTNRVSSGGAVPVVYGKNVFIGSVFVSGGLDIGDIV